MSDSLSKIVIDYNVVTRCFRIGRRTDAPGAHDQVLAVVADDDWKAFARSVAEDALSCQSCRYNDMQDRPAGGTWLCCGRIGEDTPNTCEWFGNFCGAWEPKT